MAKKIEFPNFTFIPESESEDYEIDLDCEIESDEDNDRVIWITSDVSVSCLEHVKKILKWNKEDRENEIDPEDREPIRVFIFSYGGDVNTGVNLSEVIKLSKTPIITINMGVAMSMGLTIFIEGHRRYCLRTSEAMIHSGSAEITGTYEQIESQYNSYRRSVRSFKKRIMESSSIPEEIMKLNNERDWYLDAEEQLKYGIVDAVINDIDMIL